MTDEEMHPLLIEMRGMRTEMAAIRGQNEATFKRLGEVLTTVRQIESEVGRVKSDIVLLENHNVSRHNEIMNVIARLDRAGIQP